VGATLSTKKEYCGIQIAYVDHSFHQRTKSTQFFLEALQRMFSVDVYWDNSWEAEEAFDLEKLNSQNYDLIFFFQVLYSPDLLARLNCRKLIFIPMYDAGGDHRGAFWLPFRNYWFVSFSKLTHRNLRRLGIRSFYIQYFPDPSLVPFVPLGAGRSLFFWARTSSISWPMVRDVLAKWNLNKVWIHRVPDPGQETLPINLDDLARFHIVESNWFEKREDLQSAILGHDLFVSPRSREGIGMSFLEAMAMGRCVVAVDQPTMNEYIHHRKNGLLFRKGRVAPLSKVSNIAKLGLAARNSVEIGYPQFLVRMAKLMDEIHLRLSFWPGAQLTPGFLVVTALGRVRSWLVFVKRRLKKR